MSGPYATGAHGGGDPAAHAMRTVTPGLGGPGTLGLSKISGLIRRGAGTPRPRTPRSSTLLRTETQVEKGSLSIWRRVRWAASAAIHGNGPRWAATSFDVAATIRQAGSVTGAARGAIGGSGGEIGSAHRAGAAALIVVYGLLGREVEGLLPHAGGPPVQVRMETDDPTDDILCRSTLGKRAWVQAKHEVTVGADGAGLAPVVGQWAGMIRQGSVEPGDGLVLAVARLTGPLELLRSALDRRRDPHSGALTGEQQQVLTILTTQIQQVAPDLGQDARERLVDSAVIWHVDAGDAENVLIGQPVRGREAQLGAAMLGAVIDPAVAPRAMAALTTAARTFASRRSGADMAAWLEVLRVAGTQMTGTKLPQRPVRLAPAPAYLAGRDDLLADLYDRLRRVGTPTPVVVVLCGLGGVGKTALAQAFAHRHLDDYGLVWQLRADDPTVLGTAFSELASQLGVRDPKTQHLDPVQQVHNVLAARADRWLLIFDNATDPVSLRRLLPPAGSGEIIITSQDTSWPPSQQLPVPVLKPDHAAAFLRDRSGDSDAHAAAEMAEMLGRLPLALEQAGAYSAATGTSLSQYIELFRDSRRELLARGQPVDYDGTVATTWSVAFHTLAGTMPTAITLLRLLACYAPYPVPLDLLLIPGPDVAIDIDATVATEMQALLANQLTINDAIAALGRYSLTSPPAQGDVAMHRLVQAVTLDQIPSKQLPAWRDAAAALLLAALPEDPQQPDAWPTYERLTPHALATLHATDMRRIVTYLISVGNYDTARVVQEHICEDVIDRVGADSLESATEMGNLFYIIGEAGTPAEARDGFAGLIRGCEHVLPAEHPFMLRLRSNHARWTGAAGNPAAARNLYADLWPAVRDVLGHEDPTTLTVGYNLASMIAEDGDPAGARDLYTELLPAYVNVFGRTHPETLGVRGNLAYVTGMAGDPVRARDQYVDLVPLMERILGPDHPKTLIDRANLAYMTAAVGDLTTGRD